LCDEERCAGFDFAVDHVSPLFGQIGHGRTDVGFDRRQRVDEESVSFRKTALVGHPGRLDAGLVVGHRGGGLVKAIQPTTGGRHGNRFAEGPVNGCFIQTSAGPILHAARPDRQVG